MRVACSPCSGAGDDGGLACEGEERENALGRGCGCVVVFEETVLDGVVHRGDGESNWWGWEGLVMQARCWQGVYHNAASSTEVEEVVKV